MNTFGAVSKLKAHMHDRLTTQQLYFNSFPELHLSSRLQKELQFEFEFNALELGNEYCCKCTFVALVLKCLWSLNLKLKFG